MYIQTKITKKAYFAVRNGNCEKKNWSSELKKINFYTYICTDVLNDE